MKDNLVKRGNLIDQSFVDFYNMMEGYFDNRWITKPISIQVLKIDVEEKDNEYLVEAEIPGFKKEEIEVVLKDQNLVIKAKRQESKEVKDKHYLHHERSSSEMYRSIYLEDALGNDVKAKLDQGILKVTIPKIKTNKTLKKVVIE
jgi:HSP20 family protein